MYVDSSALIKRYVNEHDSAVAVEFMAADPVLATSRITEVEVRRNLARVFTGTDWTRLKRQFLKDFENFNLVVIDATTCNEAARVAETTQCRSLDALHVASAMRAGPQTTLLTFDIRQAQAARSMGLAVVGT